MSDNEVLAEMETLPLIEKNERAERIRLNQEKARRQQKIREMLAFGGEKVHLAAPFFSGKELASLRHITVGQN